MQITAERIKNLRESRKMTQVRLGIEISVTQETISGYEIGRIVPPADMLVKLADCLHTSTDYLLGRTNNSVPFGPATLSNIENDLLYHFRRLSDANQQRVFGFMAALDSNER